VRDKKKKMKLIFSIIVQITVGAIVFGLIGWSGVFLHGKIPLEGVREKEEEKRVN